MDEILAANWDGVRDVIKNKDFDWVHISVGREGMGKSTDAIHNCMYIYSDFFKEDNVVLTVDEMKAAYARAKKGEGYAIEIDEGSKMFFKRRTMSKVNVEAVEALMGLRGKNCFINICMPDLFDFDKYILKHRVNSCSRIVARGRGWFYSKAKIKEMIKKYKIDDTNYWVKPNFKYSFPNLDAETRKKYLEMKDRIMAAYTAKKKKEVKFTKKGVILAMLKRGLTPQQIAKDLNTSVGYVRELRSIESS